MGQLEELPKRGAVFWPVGTGDSTSLVVDDSVIVQVDLHDLAKAQDEENPEVAVVDRLVQVLPKVGGKPYLAVFVLTHADKDHCLGFDDLLKRVSIGELWSTPRLWREFNDPDAPALCADAVAFRRESERRIQKILAVVAAGGSPSSGDRIRIVGYDSEHRSHPYDALPDEYLAGPGQTVSMLDGQDRSDGFTAFIHAPFKDDAEAERNETSLSMQVTLSGDDGGDGKVLLFGDLAHDTIMKIVERSETNAHDEYLEWDVLLAPHHCSKRVMYVKDDQGREVLQQDVLDAFERHARDGATVICSSAVIPVRDVDGQNPPHRKAYDRYLERADEVICTMSWGDEKAPSPLMFTVDASGARILRGADLVGAAAVKSIELVAAHGSGGRLAAITAAAVDLARALPPAAAAPEPADAATGPERVRAAVTTDRGEPDVPDNPVGFGR